MFMKAVPKNMKGPLGMAEYIPRGYTHTFLIRSPEKAIRSLYQIMIHEGEITFQTEAYYGHLIKYLF